MHLWVVSDYNEWAESEYKYSRMPKAENLKQIQIQPQAESEYGR
jgi:hypothetical protein